MTGDFFKGKKVLVTGHTGFKGTWLSLMLENLGAIVYGYALEGSEATPFFAEASPKIEESCMGLIQDRKKVYDFVTAAKPEIVIHLASHSTLNKGAEITDYIFDSNVTGVVNLLEAVRSTPSVKAVLIVTSDKSYKNIESDEGYTEDMELGAQDPYSTSKACQELITECYRRSFFSKDKLNIPIATARASNVIGGGDYNLTRLFPYLLDCFSNGKTAEIRSYDSIRPWQNVLDVLNGYLILVEKLYNSCDASEEFSSAFNFGPEKDGFVKVGEATELLTKEFENSEFIVSGEMKSVIETKILKLDSSKAKKVLGWSPKYTFEETIKMAADFQKRRNSGEPVRNIALDFINEYYI